jgi:uncharacterized protein (UPF0335 family)
MTQTNDYLERVKGLEQELEAIQAKYKLRIDASIQPANFFSKVFKKIIKVRWSLIARDFIDSQNAVSQS